MRKSLFSLAGIAALSLMFVGFSYAQSSTFSISDIFVDGASINDYQRLLTEYDTTRGYSTENTVTCSATGNIVELLSPVIDNVDAYEAPLYRIFVGPYTQEQLKSGDESIDVAKIITKDVKWDNATEIKATLSELEDQLNPNQVYYTFIVPIDDYDVIGTPSVESCFVLGNNMCLQGTECSALSLVIDTPTVDDEFEDEFTEEEHGAAGSCTAGMNLAYVTHTVKDNIITLQWTSLGNCNVEIAIWNPEQEEYVQLATVNMNDESYSYKMQWNGEHIFKLTNGVGEVVYKVDKAIEEPEIVPPQTGPAGNIFAILIAAVVLYGVYTIFFRKAE